jgi:hypothetical protein
LVGLLAKTWPVAAKHARVRFPGKQTAQQGAGEQTEAGMDVVIIFLLAAELI